MTTPKSTGNNKAELIKGLLAEEVFTLSEAIKIISLSKNGIITFINIEAQRFIEEKFGRKLEENDPIFDIVQESNLHDFIKILNYSFHNIPSAEFIFKTSSNTLIRFSFSPQINPEGKITQVVLGIKEKEPSADVYNSQYKFQSNFDHFHKNTIEIKRAENKLVQERNLLKTIIDNIPDYIYVLDENQRTILANKAFIKTFLAKKSEKEILGLYPHDYLPLEEKMEMID